MAEPLFLKSRMYDKTWGGTKLRDEFGYDTPTETTGEYWAISAHPNGVSVVDNGTYKGEGLDKLYREHKELFGSPESEVFPLLTKVFGADDRLGVQVHPDDAYAPEHEGELGKTECWYVTAADEDSEITYGYNAKSKEELRQLIEAGKWDDLLTKIPVRAGDFFYVPSGTMHAIGKGILILEAQQSSDMAYRIYDFDRRDAQGNLRDLHIEQLIDVLTIGEPVNSTPVTVDVDNLSSSLLVSNEFFAVYKWVIPGVVNLTQTASYLLVGVPSGQGSLKIDNRVYNIKKGDHFIFPNDVKSWEFDGELEIIASHANEK